MARGKYKRKRMLRERRQILVSDSGISTRVVHLLENSGIKTLADLDVCSFEKLSDIPGVGNAALKEIIQFRRKEEKNDISSRI